MHFITKLCVYIFTCFHAVGKFKSVILIDFTPKNIESNFYLTSSYWKKLIYKEKKVRRKEMKFNNILGIMGETFRRAVFFESLVVFYVQMYISPSFVNGKTRVEACMNAPCRRVARVTLFWAHTFYPRLLFFGKNCQPGRRKVMQCGYVKQSYLHFFSLSLLQD